jgi:hypothetical protein
LLNGSDVLSARVRWADEHPEYADYDLHLAVEYTDCWTRHTGDCQYSCFPIDHAKGFRVRILDHAMWREHAAVAVPVEEEGRYYRKCKCGYLVLYNEWNNCTKCGSSAGTYKRPAAYEEAIGVLQ